MFRFVSGQLMHSMILWKLLYFQFLRWSIHYYLDLEGYYSLKMWFIHFHLVQYKRLQINFISILDFSLMNRNAF